MWWTKREGIDQGENVRETEIAGLLSYIASTLLLTKHVVPALAIVFKEVVEEIDGPIIKLRLIISEVLGIGQVT